MYQITKSSKLYQAILENSENEVKLLLYDGIDLNFKDTLGKTPLYICAEKGYLSIFKLLLNKGANFDCIDSDGETCFHIACRRGHLEIIETLLNDQFRSKITSSVMNEALDIAIDSFRLELVRLLLTHGANPIGGQKGRFRLSPLHKASKSGCKKIVELLLEFDLCKENIDMSLEDGTSLHLACRRGKNDVVKCLIRHGANVNSSDAENNTPLHLAVLNKHVETVEILLHEGADCNIQNIHGHTALHVAVKMKESHNMEPREKKTKILIQNIAKLGIIENLLQNGSLQNMQDINGNSPLHIAIINGYHDVIPALIKHKADVNIPNCEKLTPLHLAISKNCECGIIHLMLKASGDTNMQDGEGNTSLHFIAYRGFFEMVNLFLKYKTDPNIQNKHGVTPFHIICEESDCMKTTEHILNYGGNPNVQNISGDTPLHLACMKGSHNIIKLILEKGGDPNIRNKLGETSLHKALDNINRQVVSSILLKYGANPNIEDNNGNTPVHKIYISAFVYCVGTFLKNGANVQLPNKKNETAIDIAIRLKHSSILIVTLKEYGDVNILNGNTRAIKLLISNTQLCLSLCNNIVMRDCADLYLPRRPRKIFQALRSNYGDFYNECRKELEALKMTSVGNSNVTYYNIMKGSVGKISKSAKNSNIIEVMKSGEHRLKFPIYTYMIEVNFKKALERKSLMDSAFSICNLVFSKLPKLPHFCIDYVLNFMTNDDLRKFITVSQ